MVEHTVYSKVWWMGSCFPEAKKEQDGSAGKGAAQGLTTRILLAESHMVEGGNWPPEVVWHPHIQERANVYTHTCTRTHKCNLKILKTKFSRLINGTQCWHNIVSVLIPHPLLGLWKFPKTCQASWEFPVRQKGSPRLSRLLLCLTSVTWVHLATSSLCLTASSLSLALDFHLPVLMFNWYPQTAEE